MKILGIDPGLTTTGWGLLQKKEGACMGWALADHGKIKPSPKEPLAHRLAVIYKELDAILNQHGPEVIVVEKVFVNKNPRSALVLGYVRGIAMMAAALRGAYITEYTATAAKSALTGYGHASKEQVIAMVMHLFNVSLLSDTADAVALAFCHSQRCKGIQRKNLIEHS